MTSERAITQTHSFQAVGYPLRLHSGMDALNNLASEVRRANAKRAFIICGQTVSRRTKLLHRIIDQLGVLYAGAFDEMGKDCMYDTVVSATAAARSASADLIIAVGGGSVIQGARVVVILLAEKGNAYDLMTQYPAGKPAVSPRLLAPKLPIINVLTTPTSAMNRGGSALKNNELDHRMEFFDPKTRPVAIFWDSEALLTAPLSLARSAGTTTYTGGLQGVAAPAANPLVEGDYLQACRLASRALPSLIGHPADPAPRLDLCAAAFLQNRAADDGLARGRDRIWSTSYALATALHIRYDHVGQGEATSAVTPSVIRLAAGRTDLAARLAQALGVWRERMTTEIAADSAADTLESFYRSIMMPVRVRELQIPENDLPQIAQDTLMNFNANPSERPPDYSDKMLETLHACW
jgi:alcohol dehydrogenase class IV